MKWITLVAGMLLVACAGNSGSETTAPVVTMLVTEYQTEWTPAWSPTDTETVALAAALTEASLVALLPVSPPDPAGAELSAEIRLTRTQPTGIWGADLAVRMSDGAVYVSVQNRPTLGEPICLRHLDVASPSWVEEPIRGTDGCSLQVDNAVSFIEWTEMGQNFHAEFPPEVAMADVIEWLDDWRPLGKGVPAA